MSRADLTALRKVVGKPRRLSVSFLLEERRKLHTFRDDCRRVQQGLVRVHRWFFVVVVDPLLLLWLRKCHVFLSLIMC